MYNTYLCMINSRFIFATDDSWHMNEIVYATIRTRVLTYTCTWAEVEQLLAFIRLYYKRSTKVSGEQMVDERRQRGNDQENKWRCPLHRGHSILSSFPI